MQGGCRAAHEGGPGDQVLQVPLGGEQPFPVGKLVEGRHDGGIVPRGVVLTNSLRSRAGPEPEQEAACC